VTKFPTPSIDWAALSPELDPPRRRRGLPPRPALPAARLAQAFLRLRLDPVLPRRGRRRDRPLPDGRDRHGRRGGRHPPRPPRRARAGLIAGSGLLTVGVSYAYVLASGWASTTPPAHRGGGMCFFVAASNLMTMFLGLEWFSISLYILCAIAIEEPLARGGPQVPDRRELRLGDPPLRERVRLRRHRRDRLRGIRPAASAALISPLFLSPGSPMFIVGLGSRPQAAPFHMWTPDVLPRARQPPCDRRSFRRRRRISCRSY
jgi:hypothetical protein